MQVLKAFKASYITGPVRFLSNINTSVVPSSALFQFVSTESREYEDLKTILTSGYIDTNSAACFSYSNPRLVHSEPLEKEVRIELIVAFYFSRSIGIQSTT